MDLSTKLEYYWENLEERIDSLSVCLTSDTLSICDEIMSLNEKKVLLCNLKVIYSYFIAALKKDERLIIEEYAKNQTLEAISKMIGCSKSTVMRRLNKAVKKCSAVIMALGYNAAKLNSEYGGYAAVCGTYNRIRREHEMRRAAGQQSAADSMSESFAQSAQENITPPDSGGESAYLKPAS